MISKNHTPRLFAAAALFCVVGAAPAVAQQYGSQDVGNRLERIEREMQTLSRQVYRGGASGGASAGATGAVRDLPAGYAAEFEPRLQGLEGAMRNLTGQVERLRHDMNQLNGRLDRALGDIEYRLENSDGASASPQSAPGVPVTQQPRIVRPNAINNVNNNPVASAPPASTTTGSLSDIDPDTGTVRTLGVLPADGGSAGALPADNASGSLPGGAIEPGSNASQPLETATTGAANTGGVMANQTASATPVAVTLPDGDAQTQYDYAFGLLKRYQFDAAADALGQFLALHPNDPLAANAQFWLGETHFVNGDYREAAVAFATGYEKFPGTEKGPENLLKLGMSLGRLGQKQEACMTLTRLSAEYPQATSSVKQQALAERRDLECGDS